MMNPYTIIGGLVLLIVVGLGGCAAGMKIEAATWQKKAMAERERAAIDLAIAHDRNRRIQLSNEANARKATAQHEQAISDLTQKYDAARAAIRAAGGLRISATVCRTAIADQSPSTGRPDEGPAASVALPAETERRLLDLAQHADELAERLRALQDWVKANGHYGEPK